MAVYSYVKKYSSPKKKAASYFSYISLIIGSVLLFWSFYPIVSFELYSRFFLNNSVKKPVSQDSVPSLDEAGSVLGNFSIFSNNLRDYTQASLWFPDRPQVGQPNLNVKQYTLSIPKINIKDAVVTVGGEDLTKSLVHYLPTSLPGEYGNVDIFGHSTLPQLYNPKDYRTVFTFLPSLEKGDDIFVKVGGVQYQYQVISMKVVDPKDVAVLDQDKSGSYLTLITCVPPGTIQSRLVVKAKLQLF